MVPFALALLLAAGPRPAAAKDAACAEAYDPSYEQMWETPREEWVSQCAGDSSARELIPKMQRRFIDRCRRSFQRAIDDKTLPKSKVYAYCAQGVPGRERLDAILHRPPPSSAEPPRTPSRKRLMGPVSESLRIARTHWSASACLTGVRLAFHDLDQDGRVDETLTYYFYSPERWKHTFSVEYLNAGSAAYQQSDKNPKTVAACFRGFNVDLDGALEAAAENGLARPSKFRSGESYRLELFARTARDPVWVATSDPRRQQLALEAVDGVPFLDQNESPLTPAGENPPSLIEFCGGPPCP